MLLRRIFNRHTLVELLPTVVFFLANAGWGLTAATVATMVATPAMVALGWHWQRRIPVIPLVFLAIVLLLGGAGLLFDDDTFVKVKPTVGGALFAAALAVGLRFRPSFLARAFAGQLSLTAVGWRRLTLCWIAIALASAGLNEAVWRAADSDTWVAVKTVADPLRIFLYVAITTMMARRHWVSPSEASHE